MRAQLRSTTILLATVVAVGCHSPPKAIERTSPPAPRHPSTTAEEVPDPFAEVDELIATGESRWRSYVYPDDYYETPAAAKKKWTGRWAIDFEGSVFQEDSTGDLYTTTGVDHILMPHVTLKNQEDDWAACLTVEIVAALAEYPSPYATGSAPWLIVWEVVTATTVPGVQRVGDPCLDFSRPGEST